MERMRGSYPRYRPSAPALRVVFNSLPRLIAMGLYPSGSRSSPSYLPKLIRRHGLAEGCESPDLARAMQKLLGDGAIVRVPISYYKNRTARYGLQVDHRSKHLSDFKKFYR